MILDPVPAYVVKTTDARSGEKVFINVCTDEQVSPPATLDSGEIEMRALRGDDWVVPIVVSAGRTTTDKAGAASAVYDCCMNPAVVLLGIENSGVKVLTVETCLELVEQSGGRVLDRNYRFPRMRAKGELARTEFNADTPHAQASQTSALEIAPEIAPAEPALAPAGARRPVVEVVATSEAASPFYFHLYRGPYSGDGSRPSHTVEIAGSPGGVLLTGSVLSLESAERLELGFVPTKHDAFYSADDDTTYVMLWRPSKAPPGSS